MMKAGLGGGGLIGVVILLLLVFSGGGSDLGDMLDQFDPATANGQQHPIDPASDRDADLVVFLGDVLADSQAMWAEIFQSSELSYRPAHLVVFDGFTQSSCGGAQAQSGPHYCPVDEQVYMDLEFLEELQNRFGAHGDTAQAYILAHEVAHHVQNQLEVISAVDEIRRTDPGSANEASIALELQADCFAGVWLSTLRLGTSAAVLEDDDLEEALNAAAAVGDDAIQSQTTGRVNPESWTHGSSEQRYRWLKTGFDTADPSACDTF